MFMLGLKGRRTMPYWYLHTPRLSINTMARDASTPRLIMLLTLLHIIIIDDNQEGKKKQKGGFDVN